MRLFSARVENVTVGREMCALDPKRRRYCVISCEKKGGIFDPRIELGTFCVLSRRDNRLHQPNLPVSYYLSFDITRRTLIHKL